MRNKLIVAVAVISFALTGCKTMEPQKTQAQVIQDQFIAKVEASKLKMKACGEQVEANPKVKQIKESILFIDKDAKNRFELMANENTLTDEQVDLLKSAIPMLSKCRVHLDEAYSGTPFTKAINATGAALDDLYLKMIKRELTIGQANVAKAKILDVFVENAQSASAEWNANINRMHTNEVQQRQQAAAIMLPYLMQQQQLQQQQSNLFYQQQMQNIRANTPTLRSPTYTNCQWIGQQLQCTTR